MGIYYVRDAVFLHGYAEPLLLVSDSRRARVGCAQQLGSQVQSRDASASCQVSSAMCVMRGLQAGAAASHGPSDAVKRPMHGVQRAL